MSAGDATSHDVGSLHDRDANPRRGKHRRAEQGAARFTADQAMNFPGFQSTKSIIYGGCREDINEEELCNFVVDQKLALYCHLPLHNHISCL